jgi:hypothetical protein
MDSMMIRKTQEQLQLLPLSSTSSTGPQPQPQASWSRQQQATAMATVRICVVSDVSLKAACRLSEFALKDKDLSIIDIVSPPKYDEDDDEDEARPIDVTRLGGGNGGCHSHMTYDDQQDDDVVEEEEDKEQASDKGDLARDAHRHGQSQSTFGGVDLILACGPFTHVDRDEDEDEDELWENEESSESSSCDGERDEDHNHHDDSDSESSFEEYLDWSHGPNNQNNFSSANHRHSGNHHYQESSFPNPMAVAREQIASAEGIMTCIMSQLENIVCRVAYLPSAQFDPPTLCRSRRQKTTNHNHTNHQHEHAHHSTSQATSSSKRSIHVHTNPSLHDVYQNILCSPSIKEVACAAETSNDDDVVDDDGTLSKQDHPQSVLEQHKPCVPSPSCAPFWRRKSDATKSESRHNVDVDPSDSSYQSLSDSEERRLTPNSRNIYKAFLPMLPGLGSYGWDGEETFLEEVLVPPVVAGNTPEHENVTVTTDAAVPVPPHPQQGAPQSRLPRRSKFDKVSVSSSVTATSKNNSIDEDGPAAVPSKNEANTTITHEETKDEETKPKSQQQQQQQHTEEEEGAGVHVLPQTILLHTFTHSSQYPNNKHTNNKRKHKHARRMKQDLLSSFSRQDLKAMPFVIMGGGGEAQVILSPANETDTDTFSNNLHHDGNGNGGASSTGRTTMMPLIINPGSLRKRGQFTLIDLELRDTDTSTTTTKEAKWVIKQIQQRSIHT